MNAAHLLYLVNRVAPGAVIAGGYVRDRILHREPKDVDIYLHVPHQDIHMLKRQFHAELDMAMVEGEVVATHEAGNYLDGAFQRRLKGVVKYQIEDLSVDLLMFPEEIAPNAFNVFASFDCALSQAAILAHGEYVASSGFLKDLADETLTIFFETKHTARMQEKFPLRRVVNAFAEFPPP